MVWHLRRSGRWEFILWPAKEKTEHYDLANDPGEQDNLACKKSALAGLFRIPLESILALQKKDGRGVDQPDEDTIAMLKALGYM